MTDAYVHGWNLRAETRGSNGIQIVSGTITASGFDKSNVQISLSSIESKNNKDVFAKAYFTSYRTVRNLGGGIAQSSTASLVHDRASILTIENVSTIHYRLVVRTFSADASISARAVISFHATHPGDGYG